MSQSQSELLTRFAIEVTGLATEADARELREALEIVPGIVTVEVDTDTGGVEFDADSRRAVSDAKWVAKDLGYEAH